MESQLWHNKYASSSKIKDFCSLLIEKAKTSSSTTDCGNFGWFISKNKPSKYDKKQTEAVLYHYDLNKWWKSPYTTLATSVRNLVKDGGPEVTSLKGIPDQPFQWIFVNISLKSAKTLWMTRF